MRAQGARGFQLNMSLGGRSSTFLGHDNMTVTLNRSELIIPRLQQSDTVTLDSLDTAHIMSTASLGLTGRRRVRRRERVERARKLCPKGLKPLSRTGTPTSEPSKASGHSGGRHGRPRGPLVAPDGSPGPPDDAFQKFSVLQSVPSCVSLSFA